MSLECCRDRRNLMDRLADSVAQRLQALRIGSLERPTDQRLGRLLAGDAGIEKIADRLK